MTMTQRTTAPGGASPHVEARAPADTCLTPPPLTAAVRLILFCAISTVQRQMSSSSYPPSGASQTLQRCVSLGQPMFGSSHKTRLECPRNGPAAFIVTGSFIDLGPFVTVCM